MCAIRRFERWVKSPSGNGRSVDPFPKNDKSQVVENEIHEVAIDSAGGDLVLRSGRAWKIECPKMRNFSWTWWVFQPPLEEAV